MHWLLAYYHWLVLNNLWRDVISWTVGVLLGLLVAHRPWKNHVARTKDIQDKLNTDTSGGLGQIRDMLNELIERRNNE